MNVPRMGVFWDNSFGTAIITARPQNNSDRLWKVRLFTMYVTGALNFPQKETCVLMNRPCLLMVKQTLSNTQKIKLVTGLVYDFIFY